MTTIKLFCAITVKNGERVPIEVNSEASSSQLRQEVSRATKIPLADLRLIFRGKMIKDDASPAVTAYKLENENVLHCMGKPSEGDLAPATTPAVAPTSISNSTAAAAFPSIPAASASVLASATAVDPLQSALTTLRSSNPPQVYSTAMTTLAKVLSNIADHPMEDKYRKVKKGNAAFNKKLGGLSGGDAAMRAVGFVLEVQDGAEVYQLHASAEAWPKLMAAKASIEAAAAEAKRALDSPVPPMGGANPLFPPAAGAGMPGMMGGIPHGAAAALNNPMAQSAMTEMMRNPEMMRNMLQNPMVQQMMQNDPNITPMQRNMMQQLASNPAMLDQMSNMMRDPAMMSRMQSMMGAGGMMPGGMGMPAAPPTAQPGQAQSGNSSGNANSGNPSGNDQNQTEEEMIAEAIRRSLQDN